MDWTEIITAVVGGVCLVINGIVLRKQNNSEKRRNDSHKRMEIILECTEACLYGVHELGANGKTTEAIQKLEHYKNEKAAL